MRWAKALATLTKWLTAKQQDENKEIVTDQSKKLDSPTDMDDRSELCFPGDLHIKQKMKNFFSKYKGTEIYHDGRKI